MAHSWETGASRWRVATANGQMVALHHEETILYACALSLDASQRVIRCGVREKVAVDVRTTLPPDARLVAVESVLDRELAVSLTLLVFCREDGSQPRPAKRARRDGSSSQIRAGTRLMIFSLWRGANDGWELQSLGDVELEGPPSRMAVRIADGPSVLVHSSVSQELALLTMSLDGSEGYTFSVASQGLKLPVEEPHGPVEVQSCQLIDSDLTPTPHLLVQCMVHEEDEAASSDQVLEWRPKRESQLWVTVTIPSKSSQVSIQPCVYIPDHSLPDATSVASEHITSCTMVALGPPTISITDIRLSLPPRLHPSVTLLLGSSTGALHVISNEVRLGSYVVAGAPKSIKVVNPTVNYDKPLIVAVNCNGSDRSFHLLSVNISAGANHNIAPMQQFKFVGSWLACSSVEHGDFSQSLVLLNDTDSTSEGRCLERTLRKSVVITYDPGVSPHASSSCHRLKLKSEERNVKQSKSAQEGKTPNSTFIERVKLDRRDDEMRDGNTSRSRDQPNASDQQLEMLGKSLETRLRIGRLQRDRLQTVSKEKYSMVVRLSNLLVRSELCGREEESTAHQHFPLNMVNVITSSTSSGLREEDDSSLFRLINNELLVQVRQSHKGKASDEQKVFASVVALQSPHTELRSRSRTLSSSADRTHFSFEVEVEIPIQHRARPLSIGVYIQEFGHPRRVSTINSPAAPCIIGEISFDPIVAAKEGGCVGQMDRRSRGNEHLLIISRGSCLRSWIGSMDQGTRSLFSIVHPLFAAADVRPSIVNEYHVNGLLRHLPRDTIAMVNPLSVTSLSALEELLASLQSELGCIQMLEKSSNSGTQEMGFLQTQEDTDLHVVRLLNVLQQRVNFHVKMRIIKL